MSRNSIFELIKGNSAEFITEYERINLLFNTPEVINNTYSIFDYADRKLFKTWKHRGRYITLSELMNELKFGYICTMREISSSMFLNYLELVYNMIFLVLSCYKKEKDKRTPLIYMVNEEIFHTLVDNIQSLLEDMNYGIQKKDDEMYVIIEKDKFSTAVAETNPDVCDTTIEYRRFSLKGNTEAKKRLLKILADKVEPLKEVFKSTTYNSLMDDVQYLLNNLNIRHNNLEGGSKKDWLLNMDSEKLEKLYDLTYDMILTVLLAKEYLEKKSIITDMKTQGSISEANLKKLFSKK